MWRVLGGAIAALGVLGIVAGVGAMIGTCFGGARLAGVDLARQTDGSWRAVMPAVGVPPGASVTVDTWSDYDGAGAIAFEALATSPDGSAIALAETMTDDEGGSTLGSFTRVGRFEPRVAGAYAITVTARARGEVSIAAASAVVRAGALDLEIPGIALLTLGIFAAIGGGAIGSMRSRDRT